MVKGILKISLINKRYILKISINSIFFSTIIVLFFFLKVESYAVASRHHLATDIGMQILENGGSIDLQYYIICISCGESFSW